MQRGPAIKILNIYIGTSSQVLFYDFDISRFRQLREYSAHTPLEARRRLL